MRWCCVGIEGTKQEGFLKILKEIEVLWDSSAVMNCILVFLDSFILFVISFICFLFKDFVCALVGGLLPILHGCICV